MPDQQQTNNQEQPAPPPSSPHPPPARHRDPSGSDDEVIPSRSSDEYDRGWGEDGAGRDDDWYQRERPPHHE